MGGKFLARRWLPPILMTLVRTDSVTLRVARVPTVRLTGVRSLLVPLGVALVLTSRWWIRVDSSWSFSTLMQVNCPPHTLARYLMLKERVWAVIIK